MKDKKVKNTVIIKKDENNNYTIAQIRKFTDLRLLHKDLTEIILHEEGNSSYMGLVQYSDWVNKEDLPKLVRKRKSKKASVHNIEQTNQHKGQEDE